MCLTLNVTQVYSISFKLISGYWSVSLDESDLVSAAGSDFAPVESTTFHVEFEISGQGAKEPWGLNIRKSDTVWNNNFTLYIKRTSNGDHPEHPIYGGTSFVEITDSNTLFISGEGDNKKIFCQLKLVCSVAAPPETYSLDVVYTAFE